uniref:Uncharacterized protein n=1 Tax=Leersia perrieri TaxID=77586 RepID=A0A0D9W559_9ORYZ
MMSPEMMRVAQEQMSRMSPSALAAMQQQIMSNPNLIKLATDTISTLSPDDIRRTADQLNQTRPDEMLDMAKKLAASTPDEVAAMKVQAEQRMAYVVTTSKSLKNQGNDLFKVGKYTEAAAKYRLAVDNLKSVPSKDAQNLQKTCSVNLMACYLKIGRFGECVAEGCEVLGYDPSNVKTYYRRGQAYREMGNLEAAVGDLRKAHELSPDEETIGEVLKDVEEKLAVKLPRGIVIEEIVEEEEESGEEKQQGSELSSGETSVSQPCHEASPLSSSSSSPAAFSAAGMQEVVMNSMKDPAIQGLFTNMLQNMDPEVISDISRQFGMEINKDDAAKVQKAISSMSPENLDKMMRWMNRAQRAVEAARKAKKFLLARKGFMLALVILILAFILARLGFLGGNRLFYL